MVFYGSKFCLEWAYLICRKSLMWLPVPALPCHANAQFGITLLTIICLLYDDLFLQFYVHSMTSEYKYMKHINCERKTKQKRPSQPSTESMKNSDLNAIRTHDLCDELAVSLIAQLIEHCTGIAEDMGLNPVQACLVDKQCMIRQTVSIWLLYKRFNIRSN